MINIKQEDILQQKQQGRCCKVLGVCGEVYFLSLIGNTHRFGYAMTIEDIKEEFIIDEEDNEKK